MQKVLLYFNSELTLPSELLKTLVYTASEKNIELYCYPKAFKGFTLYDPSKKQEQFDLAIVLGGDGTYISASHFLLGQATPILGLHLGSLGFLTKHPLENATPLIKMAFKNELKKYEYNWLEVSCGSENFFCLNEVVIERGTSTQVLSLNIFSQNELIFPLTGDGVSICSALGSTAYNLAAGGPILHPQSQCWAITPICSHSLTSRPFVCKDSFDLSVKLSEASVKKKLSAQVTLDGKSLITLQKGQSLKIKKSHHKHISLDLEKSNYFNRLKVKFKMGERS